jgi:ubiquinone biosynthesis protein UbiJ
VSATPAWLASVEAVMNRDLAESMRATALARQLEGRSLHVTAGSLLDLRAAIQGGRLFLSAVGTPAADAKAADAEISGPVSALLGLFSATAANPGSAPSVQIRGDADTANRFRDLFKLLRPDPEAQLARLIGDVPAHGLAQFTASALDWGRRALDSGRRNVAEYLEEESRDLVNKTEMEEFLRGVDLAREAADRAEARLVLLERRRGVRT